MLTRNHIVAGLLFASSIASVGCDATLFNQVNEGFKAIKTSTSAIGNTAMPAAAIASSLGAIEVIRVLSGTSTSKKATTPGDAVAQGVIAASGVIAAGDQRFSPDTHFGLLQVGDTRSEPINTPQIKATITFTSERDANGNVTSSISGFKGVTHGYNIDAIGAFTFKPNSSGSRYALSQAGDARGAVACTMNGSVSYSDLKVLLKTLKFDTVNPLPKGAVIGEFVMEGKDGDNVVSINAKLSTSDSGKIKASGTLTSEGKTKPINFDQEKPSGDTAAPAANP